MYCKVKMLSSGPKADTDVAVVGSAEPGVMVVDDPLEGAGVIVEERMRSKVSTPRSS